jgi:cell division protein FtsX
VTSRERFQFFLRQAVRPLPQRTQEHFIAVIAVAILAMLVFCGVS